MPRLTTPEFHVRPVRRPDVTELLAIDAESFAEPVSEERLLKKLRGIGAADGTIGFVVETIRRGFSPRPLAGYVLYRPCRPPGFDPALVIDRLAVAPDLRRRGVGTLLAGRACEAARVMRLPTVGVVVPEDDLRALLWLGRRGFRAVKLWRGVGTDLDRIAMERPA